MLLSNIHKSVIVINSIETRFSRNVFEVVPWGKIGFVTGNPGSVIVPQYGSSKSTVFVWGKNTILKFLGNTS